jgi:cap2 methyltransferase
MFSVPAAPIDPMMAEFKKRTNDCRSRLDEKDLGVWKRHTRDMLQTSNVIRDVRDRAAPELGTGAFLKMYEMLECWDLKPTSSDVRSVHLCEAPGAFISATNHYLRMHFGDELRLKWTGLTLNPHYEDNDPEAMVEDDKFILQTLSNWCFGADNRGDIRSAATIEMLRSSKSGAHLVTADGSIDCSANPNEQEAMVAHLHFCEAVAALHLLCKGGHFVLKMFTLFENDSVHLLYLLACTFESVKVHKPATSTQGNAEVYIVCKRFMANISDEVLVRLRAFVDPSTAGQVDLFDSQHLPKDFMGDMRKCADVMSRHMCTVIERNLRTEGKVNGWHNKDALQRLKQDVAKEYLDRTKIERIRDAWRLVPQELVGGSDLRSGLHASLGKRGRDSGTLEERREAKQGRVEGREANQAFGGEGSTRRSTLVAPASDAPTSAEDKPNYGTFAAKMMAQMGHRAGEGLGPDGSGRREPIEVQQRGSAGLGFESSMAGDAPFFLSTDGQDADELNCDAEAGASWRIECGSRFKTISMSKFCLRELLTKLLTMRREVLTDPALVSEERSPQLKLASLKFASCAMLQAHSHEKTFTHAEDALKLAHLDSLFGVCRQRTLQPFRFAVLAANTQGIAEYIAWRHGAQAHGRTVDELTVARSLARRHAVSSR